MEGGAGCNRAAGNLGNILQKMGRVSWRKVVRISPVHSIRIQNIEGISSELFWIITLGILQSDFLSGSTSRLSILISYPNAKYPRTYFIWQSGRSKEQRGVWMHLGCREPGERGRRTGEVEVGEDEGQGLERRRDAPVQPPLLRREPRHVRLRVGRPGPPPLPCHPLY